MERWPGAGPPTLKKVTKVTKIAYIDIKLCKVKNKRKGDQGPGSSSYKKVTKVTKIAYIDIKLCKLKNKWKGAQERPPPPLVKKVTKVTKIA